MARRTGCYIHISVYGNEFGREGAENCEHSWSSPALTTRAPDTVAAVKQHLANGMIIARKIAQEKSREVDDTMQTQRPMSHFWSLCLPSTLMLFRSTWRPLHIQAVLQQLRRVRISLLNAPINPRRRPGSIPQSACRPGALLDARNTSL